MEFNENWRQLLFFYRSYKRAQLLKQTFEGIERNHKRDWEQHANEIGIDPLIQVWGIGKELKSKWIRGPAGKIGNELSESYWNALLKEALICNRTYVEYLSKMFGFRTSPIIASAILGMIGDPARFRKPNKQWGRNAGLRSLWHYCGLHTDYKTGEVPRRKKGTSIDWNPDLKAVLLEHLGRSLISKRSKYRELYEKTYEIETAKHDWETCKSCQRVYKKNKKKTMKLHVFNRTRRKVVKQFVKDLWSYWYPPETQIASESQFPHG